MPYADPEKKREYMVRYNSEYYEKKRDDIIPRVNKNKNKYEAKRKSGVYTLPQANVIIVLNKILNIF